MIFSALPRTLRQQLGRPRACLCPLPKNSHCQVGDVTTKKRVTMGDICQKAQVSLSTVSMILNKKGDMSFAQETVQRVLDAARELGYKKPEFARTRPLTDSKTIVIVCPNIANAYYATIAQAIQRAAAKREYTGIILTTYRSAQREEDALEMAISLGVSGIIFTMMPQNAERIEEINRKIPIVVIGDRNTSLNVDTIELDNFKAGTLIGQHLLELGHRRMAFISTTLDAVNNIRRRRLAGLQEALEGKGATLQVLSRDITPEEELDNLNIEYATGLALTEECLKRYPKCTALVAVNDSVAYGVLDALTAHGLKVPEECSVCAFDNLPFSRLSCMDLTSVEHHIAEKGRNAFEMFFDRISKKSANNITRVEFSHYLRVGKTTGPCPGSREV